MPDISESIGNEENRLLQNEVETLTRDMHAVSQRLQATQEGQSDCCLSFSSDIGWSAFWLFFVNEEWHAFTAVWCHTAGWDGIQPVHNSAQWMQTAW